jgi:hypothetical protein
MNIAAVIPGYLYSVDQVLPEELLKLINSIDWPARPAAKLAIGHGRRRQINYSDHLDHRVSRWCFDDLKQAIELACQVKFTHPEQQSFQYWLDQPGFRPARHTDGNLPSAVQIYLQAADRWDLGTAFYPSSNHQDPMHTFNSDPNTGYIMLNQPEPGRPGLWHDMTQPVPEGVDRLCLYITLGQYQRL